MAVLEAGLAVFGLFALCMFCWYLGKDDEPADAPPVAEGDLAAPYREGLHAAMRIQVAVQDQEQQMYAEAIRHAGDDPGGES
jgi:hypothetical protein